jgi:hypothetical protein
MNRSSLCLAQIESDRNATGSWGILRFMADVFKPILWPILDLSRSRASLEAEIVVLRQQLNVMRRKSTQRRVFSTLDRLFFAGLLRLHRGLKTTFRRSRR